MTSKRQSGDFFDTDRKRLYFRNVSHVSLSIIVTATMKDETEHVFTITINQFQELLDYCYRNRVTVLGKATI